MSETTSNNPNTIPVVTTPRVADLHLITTKRRSLLSDAWFRLVRNKASMAGLVIIVLFFFTQKTFIQGVTLTGIKG